jgi:hypothetical protein
MHNFERKTPFPIIRPQSMTRIARVFMLLLMPVVITVTNTAHGQTSGTEPEIVTDSSTSQLTLVNWVLTAGASSTADPSSHIAMASLSGNVPLRSLLPQTSPDSRITFAGLEGGVQSEDGTSQFAYRFLGLDLTLQRAWWSGSVKMLDLASNSLMEFDRTWFAVGTGPGIHQDLGGGALNLQLQANAGRRSASLKHPVSTIGDGSGWYAGIKAAVGARLNEWLFVSGQYAASQFSSGNLVLNDAGVLITGKLSPQWMLELHLRAILDAPATATGTSKKPSQIGFRLGYVIN